MPGVVVIANRIGARPWSTGSTIAPLLRALQRRCPGDQLTLVADSIDDANDFDGIAVRTFRPYEQTATAFPVGFPGWAARAVRTCAADRVISFSQRFAAAAWFPVDAAPRAWIRHKTSCGSAAGAAITLARTPGVLLASAQPKRASAAPRPLPAFSMQAPASDDERAAAREAVRARLGVADGRPLLLLSAPGSLGQRLDGLLAGLARAESPPPVLAALVRDTFSLERQAREIGGEPLLNRLRILTTTLNIRPLLLAADAAVTPFRSSLTHRFASDALRLGTPVLGVQGYRLPTPEGSWAPAANSKGGDVEAGWWDTLSTSLAPEAMASARAAVSRASPPLAIDRVIDAVLAALPR